MKKILTTAAIIGLVAVPSMAFASQDTRATPPKPSTTATIKQEDQATKAGDDAVTATPTSNSTVITEAEARATAQGQQPTKTIAAVVRDTEHGVEVFSAKFSDDSRVDVNATSGTVVPVDDEVSVTPAEANSTSNDQTVGANHSGSNHQVNSSAQSKDGSNHTDK